MSDDKEGWFWFAGSNDEWYRDGPFSTRAHAIAALDEAMERVTYAALAAMKGDLL